RGCRKRRGGRGVELWLVAAVIRRRFVDCRPDDLARWRSILRDRRRTAGVSGAYRGTGSVSPVRLSWWPFHSSVSDSSTYWTPQERCISRTGTGRTTYAGAAIGAAVSGVERRLRC